MALTLTQMIAAVSSDTQDPNQDRIIEKLNAAQSWIFNRLLPMNKEILKVTDMQLTMAADTHSYDLAANVTTGTLYSIENFGVKYASDSQFLPVVFLAGSDARFLYWDQQPVQATRPVYVVIDNFNKVRFAPGLPISTVIRVDYIYGPRDMNPNTQTTCDLPSAFHQAIVSEAISRDFRALDDDRSQEYRVIALDEEYGAKNVLGIRQFMQPPRTRSSNRQRGRLA